MRKAKRELSLIKALKTLIEMPQATVVGVDFGSTSIKVAEVCWKKARPCLKAAGIAACDSSEAESLSEKLNRLLIKAGVRGTEAVFSVDGKNCFSKKITYPKMSRREIREVLRWDLEKHVPYERDSYYYDATPLETQSAKSLLLLVAAPKSGVDRRSAIIRAAGLSPMAADLEALALQRVVGIDDLMLLDLGGTSSKTYLYKDGCPVLQRRLMPLKATDSYGIESLQEELMDALQYYRSDLKAAQREKVAVCGGFAQNANLLKRLNEFLATAVETVDPLAGLEIDNSLEAQHLHSIAPQLSVAIGLALRGRVSG